MTHRSHFPALISPLLIALQGRRMGLYPQLQSEVIAQSVLGNVYETLVTFDGRLQLNDMFIRLGLPVTIQSAEDVDLEVKYEGNHVRARARVGRCEDVRVCADDERRDHDLREGWRRRGEEGAILARAGGQGDVGPPLKPMRVARDAVPEGVAALLRTLLLWRSRRPWRMS